jgi:hypothetical protein
MERNRDGSARARVKDCRALGRVARPISDRPDQVVRPDDGATAIECGGPERSGDRSPPEHHSDEDPEEVDAATGSTPILAYENAERRPESP